MFRTHSTHSDSATALRDKICARVLPLLFSSRVAHNVTGLGACKHAHGKGLGLANIIADFTDCFRTVFWTLFGIASRLGRVHAYAQGLEYDKFISKGSLHIGVCMAQQISNKAEAAYAQARLQFNLWTHQSERRVEPLVDLMCQTWF